jgi:dTDP-4-dehydrorhamnose reductase
MSFHAQSSLVVGADGFIGTALVAQLERQNVPVLQTSRRGSAECLKLDLLDPNSWCMPADVNIAFLCASRALVGDCQQHPQETRKVNVEATEQLARRLVEVGARVVFISSNLVFDGSKPFRKSDEPSSPMTEYGRQKAETERRLLRLGDQVTIVRFSKVLHPKQGLLKQWTAALYANSPIHPFYDLHVAPISVDFAASVLARIAEVPCSGIVQVSANEELTYEAVARRLARCLGVNPGLVQPISARKSAQPLEFIPAHSTLDSSWLREKFQMALPDVWSFLDEFAASV